MPRFTLGLGVDRPPGIAEEGGDSGIRIGDSANLIVFGTDGRFFANYRGDSASLPIAGTDSTYRTRITGDNANLPITGTDGSIGGQSGDTGTLVITGTDGSYRVRITGDTVNLALTGTDGRYRTGISGDTANLPITGTNGRTGVRIRGDTANISITGTDGDWEDDFVAVYDPVSVTVNASATTSSAFSIPGKICWITAPVTTSARTVTLQHTPDSGTTWNSTGITWTTSTSAQTEVNSETLSKIAGATGPSLNNFRLSYDSSLTGSTSHTVRSRT